MSFNALHSIPVFFHEQCKDMQRKKKIHPSLWSASAFEIEFILEFVMLNATTAEIHCFQILCQTPTNWRPPFSLSLMGPNEGAPRMLITPAAIHQALWFIFLWRSIDFLLFSLTLIPGSVSLVVLYRGAIIQSLITVPLAAYLLPGDSLFKPPPNDLGKLTCSTSQGCWALLMSEGVAPTQELPVQSKKKGLGMSTNTSTVPHVVFFYYRWLSQVCKGADFFRISMSSAGWRKCQSLSGHLLVKASNALECSIT